MKVSTKRETTIVLDDDEFSKLSFLLYYIIMLGRPPFNAPGEAQAYEEQRKLASRLYNELKAS